MSDADQSYLLSKGYPSVNVLDGMTIRAGNAPRLALRAALAPSSQKQIRYTGVWRSMFMRTSTKAVDVVYSIMGIFNLNIDPFKKNRDPTFMFNDLIRKTAASPNIGAWAWLSIGGVTGNDIPPDPASRIIPRFPHDELNIAATSNKPPEMEFAGRWEWVGHHVDRSPFYIKSTGGYNTNHNINFMTHSQPHILNATMIPINQKPTSPTTKRVNTVGRKGVTRNKSMLKLLSKTAECIYSGDLIGEWKGAGSIQAVFVGTVGDMRKSSFKIATATPLRDYTGWKYFLFFKYRRSEKRWYVVANGVWNAPTWTPSLRSRVIFNVGRFAQHRFRKWRANDSEWVDQRYRRFKHSYGVEALHEWLCTDSGKRKIEWIGSKRSKPPLITASNQWYDYKFCYDKMKEVVPSDSSDDDTDGDSEEDHQDNDQIAKDDNAPLDALLKKGHIHHLRVLSCSVKSSRAPHTSTVRTHKKIIQQGIMPMTYSYGGWSKAVHVKLSKCNVEGLMIPNPWEGSGTLLKYQVRILFGNRVMYAPGQTTPVRNEDSLLT
ncbi:hypothetical protein BDU57DRAFT_493968 [Ampelomyces quisqualis]|uniref:Uncharacterized protein n=1 Tax=Ampelomyces quisqualis TaxID=50730 RepID=A0A6A5QQQ7_AMPQU|nr:hypothetical protein BDU57DRAFT_493968 [Ampelomyces quisqualis]